MQTPQAQGVRTNCPVYNCSIRRDIVPMSGWCIQFVRLLLGDIGSEMKLYVESFSERSEEVRDELCSAVRGRVQWNTVLGKDMEYE